MRDGRLTGAERASFERHVTTCSSCSREVQALEALAETLRASVPETANELHVRRERTRLLAAFDHFLVAPEHRGSLRRLRWPAVVATLAVGLVVLWRVRPATEAARAAIRADGAAVWSDHLEGDRERVVLERGALWIHVDHSSGEHRLLVALPDGELEDTGTTFTVSAEDGHTTRVAVQEGHVVLRLRGRPLVALDAGQTWIPEVPAPAAWAGAAPPSGPAPTASPAPAASNAPPRPSAPLASVLVPDPLAEFRAAMAALDVGDNHQAASGFASFLERHPHDPQAEDAAYLRVVALQRCGDAVGMKEAALEYLRRYPAGFRHAEVDGLSR
jgi:hypothetical protein